MSRHKRSTNLGFRTWQEFVGRSGRKYWIQDVPDDYKEILANYMVYGFVKEEPLFKHSFASTYPAFLSSATKFWKQEFDQNLSLICLTKNEVGDIQIAGANCLYIATRTETTENEPIKKTPTSKVMETHIYVEKRADVFNRLAIQEYLKGMGLYVLPEFRGERIGVELLKAREPFCKALGLKTTCTTFTSKFSQTIAEEVGFKDLYEITYKELSRVNKELVFPGIEKHTKSIRCMYKQYEK